MEAKIKKLAENQEKLVNKILELEKQIVALTENNNQAMDAVGQIKKILWKIKKEDI